MRIGLYSIHVRYLMDEEAGGIHLIRKNGVAGSVWTGKGVEGSSLVEIQCIEMS